MYLCVCVYIVFLFHYNCDREILSAIESTTTQTLRVTLTRQLAEVLLRRISGADYKPPEDQIDITGTVTCNHFFPKTKKLTSILQVR